MTATRAAGTEHSRGWRVPRLLLGVAATALLLVAAPSAALAHDGLVSSSPAADGEVGTAPSTVELRFTGEPLPLGTQVLVTGPDGAPVSEGPATIEGTAVVQPLAEPLPAGTYRVDWRSTSSDGHGLAGTYAFTVAGTAPSAASAPAATDGVGATDASGAASLPAVYPLAGAGLVGALGVLTARRLRRRS
ncbi:copper resistance protein CopC [Blastococcus sp. TF02A_35]|uniref:copper resistance CopC family protein n=1 Tax=Blastococcus sp. TF02A-35 TaxID=2559612 RepID=UPI001430063D|nr:copper resistance protein CopC [Blastococcus sp. TF02A_35]